MPVLAILSLALQLFCVVHALRNGRDYRWLFLIMLIPVIGIGAYFFVEVLPGLRHHRQLNRAKHGLIRAIDPQREVRQMRQQLEVANTLENRAALASACVSAGQYPEAIELYQSCLKIEEHNPELMHKLAQAYFGMQDYVRAKQTLAELIQHNPNFKSADGHLLYARTLEALGDTNGALQEYKVLIESFPGEEARVRYALLLKSLNELDEAARTFNEVVKRAARAPKYYRRAQKSWVDVAKQNL